MDNIIWNYQHLITEHCSIYKNLNYETNLKIQALPNPDTYFMYPNSISSFGVHSYHLRTEISFFWFCSYSDSQYQHGIIYHESILTLLIFLSKLWPNYSNCSTFIWVLYGCIIWTNITVFVMFQKKKNVYLSNYEEDNW